MTVLCPLVMTDKCTSFVCICFQTNIFTGT